MNRTKKSNRPLILSIISIMLCTLLLIGSTIAWFTDTETNKDNIIQAGTLDIELWVTINDTQPTTLDDNWTQITNESNLDAIFGEFFKNWQPGDEETIYFAVKNVGSLTLDYTLDLVVGNDDLSDALQFATSGINNTITGVATPYVTVSSQTVDDTISTTGVAPEELEPNTIDYTTISMKLDESTGNTYQDLEFVMDLILVATQEDLLQNDADAIVYAYDVTDINSAETNSTVILMQDITSTTAVNLENKNVNFDLNGYTLEVPSFKMYTEAYCTVDIANGTIKATGDYDVQVKNGTVNIVNTTVYSDGEIILDATTSTLNLTGTTAFLTLEGAKAKVTIMDNTRVVVDTTSAVSLKADTGANNVTVVSASSGTETELTVDGISYVYTGDEFLQAIEDNEKNIVIVGEYDDYADALYLDITKDVSIPSGTTVTVQSGSVFEAWATYGVTLTIEEGANFIIEDGATVWLCASKIVNEGTVENFGEIEFYTYYVFPTIENNSTFVNDGEILVFATNDNFSGEKTITGTGKVTINIDDAQDTGLTYNTLTNLATYVDQDVYISANDDYSTFNVLVDNYSIENTLYIPEGLTLIVEEDVTLNLNRNMANTNGTSVTIDISGTLELYGDVTTTVNGESDKDSESAVTSIVVNGNGTFIQGDNVTGLESVPSYDEDGVLLIKTARLLYTFLTTETGEEAKLVNYITYDIDTYGVMYISSKKDLDLNGNTISLLNDTSDDVTGGDSYYTNTEYPIKMDGGGNLTIYGGTFIAGMPDDSEETEIGAMGAIGYADYYNNAILNIYDMTFYNSYQGYACIQAYEMDTVTITDCTFYSYYGDAVKSACSNVIINNCTVYQDPDVSYGSNFFATQWEGYGTTTITVNGGTYSGNAKGLYVYSTGGTINVNSGTFTAQTVLKADNSSAGSTINIYGGTFDGAISIATGAILNIEGGTFSNTGLDYNAFSAYVADGYTATETSTGVYTVTKN